MGSTGEVSRHEWVLFRHEWLLFLLASYWRYVNVVTHYIRRKVLVWASIIILTAAVDEQCPVQQRSQRQHRAFSYR